MVQYQVLQVQMCYIVRRIKKSSQKVELFLFNFPLNALQGQNYAVEPDVPGNNTPVTRTKLIHFDIFVTSDIFLYHIAINHYHITFSVITTFFHNLLAVIELIPPDLAASFRVYSSCTTNRI